MKITIRPMDGFNAEIDSTKGPQRLEAWKAISIMENAKAAGGYEIRVELRAHGFTLVQSITNKALELAGLSGFAAAKQTAKGYIEF